MVNIPSPPLSGNPSPHNTKPRSDALLDLDKAEGTAFLTFTRRRGVFEKTGAVPDQIKLLEARTNWNRRYCRIQELEGAE